VDRLAAGVEWLHGYGLAAPVVQLFTRPPWRDAIPEARAIDRPASTPRYIARSHALVYRATARWDLWLTSFWWGPRSWPSSTSSYAS